MKSIDDSIRQAMELEEFSKLKSPVHKLHPLTKLFITVFYIVTVMSFEKYNVSGLLLMIIIPAMLFEIAGITVVSFFSRIKLVLPFVIALGIANPFLDKTMISVSGFLIRGGVISFITLILKGIFCLMMSYAFIATSQIDSICYALRQIKCPKMLVSLFHLTYRYIFVMMEEVSIMTLAYKLRAPNQKGIHISAWGSFLGQLLLRSMDRAEELYIAMKMRGFNGEFIYAEKIEYKYSDIMVCLVVIWTCLLFRYLNIALMIGNGIMMHK